MIILVLHSHQYFITLLLCLSGYDQPLSAPLHPQLTHEDTPGYQQRLTQTFGGGLIGGDQTHSQSSSVLVSPFVRVTFGKERKRTRTGCGPHPHWNEELMLPFQ